MPLTGFNALKAKVVDRINADDDNGMGSSYVFVRKRTGDRYDLTGQLSFSGGSDTDPESNSLMVTRDLSILMKRSDIDDLPPTVGDTVEYEGEVYGTVGDITEDGRDWWRVVFFWDHTLISQVSGKKSR